MKKFCIIAIFAVVVALLMAVGTVAYSVGYSAAVHNVEAVEVAENGYTVTFNDEVYCYE